MSDLNLKKYIDLAVVEEPVDGTTLLAVDPDGLLTRVPNKGNTPAPGGLGGVPSTIFVPVWMTYDDPTDPDVESKMPSPARFPMEAVEEHTITAEDNVYYNTPLDCLLERNPQSINDLCLNYDLSNVQIIGFSKSLAGTFPDTVPAQYIDKFGYAFTSAFWVDYESWTQIPDSDIFMNNLDWFGVYDDIFTEGTNPSLKAIPTVYKIGDNGVTTYCDEVQWTTTVGDGLESHMMVLLPDDIVLRLDKIMK